MKNDLTNDQLLLIEQFVDFYKKIPSKQFQKIKKEVNMEFVATTISEHIIIENEKTMKTKWLKEGEKKGVKKGEKRGEKRGETKGEINTLKKLYRQKILTKEQYERRVKPLRKQLESL